MNVSLPPESFRISARGYWFVVHVAASVEDMHAAMVEHVAGCHPDQLACVVLIEPSEDIAGCLGFIFLPGSHLGGGLVSHELGHASFRVCEEMQLQVTHWDRKQSASPEESTSHPSEEVYCDVLEELTRDFWTKAYALGYA